MLHEYKLMPFYIRLIERFADFGKKILKGNILKNEISVYVKTFIYNTRASKETKYCVPKSSTLNGRRRISIFLPKFANCFLVKNIENNEGESELSIEYTDISFSNLNSSYHEFMNLFKS